MRKPLSALTVSICGLILFFSPWSAHSGAEGGGICSTPVKIANGSNPKLYQDRYIVYSRPDGQIAFHDMNAAFHGVKIESDDLAPILTYSKPADAEDQTPQIASDWTFSHNHYLAFRRERAGRPSIVVQALGPLGYPGLANARPIEIQKASNDWGNYENFGAVHIVSDPTAGEPVLSWVVYTLNYTVFPPITVKTELRYCKLSECLRPNPVTGRYPYSTKTIDTLRPVFGAYLLPTPALPQPTILSQTFMLMGGNIFEVGLDQGTLRYAPWATHTVLDNFAPPSLVATRGQFDGALEFQDLATPHGQGVFYRTNPPPIGMNIRDGSVRFAGTALSDGTRLAAFARTISPAQGLTLSFPHILRYRAVAPNAYVFSSEIMAYSGPLTLFPEDVSGPMIVYSSYSSGETQVYLQVCPF